MNIFVASWFFPPATSSEGIVTYKLLRNSSHNYDVFSSSSKQWGYKAEMHQFEEKNIRTYPIFTDDIDKWVEEGIKKFDELNSSRHYSCIMTRSMPPESILLGSRIKERYPDIKWIASLADPIANNPYEIKAYIDECPSLSNSQKIELKRALKSSDEKELVVWEKRPESGIRLLCKLKRWQNTVLKMADMIISPTARQLTYMQDDLGWSHKYYALPHSFDTQFYKNIVPNNEGKVVFSFIGYSDSERTLEPIVRAIRMLKQNNSSVLDKILIRIIGNNPRHLKDMVLNYYLDDVIQFEKNVDYYKSLELMEESDWLIHVDAFFNEIEKGGSIFFAGKLADYMGAGRPILALTGNGSPADEIVSKAGGISLRLWDIEGIANTFERIVTKSVYLQLNKTYIETFNALSVARKFDKRVEMLCGENWELRINEWKSIPLSQDDKLVTICVPGYNVDRYLERCLRTLLDHEYAANLEILVIDDGSKDHTADIARTFENHYPGIVKVIQKKNGGHGSTINRAIAEGCGKYFMVVDGDDWIDSDQFASLLSLIKENDIDVDIISSNYHEVNLESGVCSPWKQNGEIEYFKELSFDEIDVDNVYFTLASSLFKLSLLHKLNKPLQEHTFYVDVEYILFPIPYVETVMFIDYYIYKYCRGNAEQSVHIPTMVNRYDHHERVLKRVLEHERTCEMTQSQNRYYISILKKLLYTHYSLCFVYDSDKERGYQRAKVFDEYLLQNNPDLARWVGKAMPAVSIARKHVFNPQGCEKDFRYRFENYRNKSRQFLKSQIKKNPYIRRFIINRYTVRIAQSEFFSNGKGKKIKTFIKKVL